MACPEISLTRVTKRGTGVSTQAYWRPDGLWQNSSKRPSPSQTRPATGDEPGRSSGGYWHERRPRKPNPLIDDDAFIARFWEESERLVARAGV